ncbi:hypothetical protein [Leucothrix mucor]|jgi:hypothetical protein|uniref:hypothetical protein n=1 Tax=Leucothrix mucor TaxID=45248 RepID=UPI0003B3AC0B|nr:hypothetical protein [Leucothrix mucor]
MIKTFTVDKIEQQIISPKKGMLTYHITDETGYSRTVSGMTLLDVNQNIKSINPIHKRELPLIDTLSHLKEQERFSLDFSAYNKYFNRETNKTINQEAYENVMMMSHEPEESPMLARIMIIASGLALMLFGIFMLIMNLG